MNTESEGKTLQTLPGDAERQIMWRMADRFDLQMLVQSTRAVARGPVARLVAEGARNSHDWTEEKNSLLQSFDESGITAAFLDPEHGGYLEGPKNLALALIAFELSWVDAGAATCSLAGNLALSPIHERGTKEQKDRYMAGALPAQPGEERNTLRGAFALTEPLPYVGVDTGVLIGKIRVAEWKEGEEPTLEVEKRGRFITNMDFANFLTIAVDSDDERIKSSCMVIVHEDDPGLYDRGAPTLKLVHQLSSTRDPIISVKVPASRIIGGYEIKDGVVVPNFNHGEVIESVFKRTRVTVALMSSAKLLSAIEPVIRYQRTRFRGGDAAEPGSPRFEMGLQQKEDALHRLIDVWCAGESGASLGFGAARLFDDFDPLETKKDEIFREQKIVGARKQMRALRSVSQDAIEWIRLSGIPASQRDADRFEELKSNPMVQYVYHEALANVLCPACKLWNTGYGATMMREAVSLMGGYGITEDCPGFLAQKWMDAQLEATYEGPEAVQRRQLTVTMLNDVFLAQFKEWIREMRLIASDWPGTGACSLGTAMHLWLWTLEYLQTAKDADGQALYHGKRQGVTFALADALCWLLAARYFILDVLELESKGPENPVLSEGLEGTVRFMTDLCHVQAARSAGEVGRICAELVFGYQKHPVWDDECGEGCCEEGAEVLEEMIPGFWEAVGDGPKHRPKAGPCVRFAGLEPFVALRSKLDGCLTGSRLAKDRAAQALIKVMIPEALDYPV